MAITVVQVSPTVNISGGTLTATLPNPTGSGNTLVACISGTGATGVRVPTGLTLGGSADNWQLAYADPATTGFAVYFWYDPNCASGQTSIVLTATAGSGANLDSYLTVYEVTGVLAFDRGIHGDNAATVANTWSSGPTLTTTWPNEISFGVVTSSVEIPVVTGVGSWTTQSDGSGTFDQVSGYQIVSATGTFTFSGTFTNSPRAYAAAVATFDIGGSPASGLPSHRPGLSRIRHHQGVRRQQLQQVFQLPTAVTVTAGAALATGAAIGGDTQPGIAQVTAFDQTGALGTGAVFNPAVQVTAFDQTGALGTGTAYSPVAQVTALPAAALGTGAACLPGWGPGTAAATGTGAAYLPGWSPGTTAAPGTGAAYNPVAQVIALPAAALGTGAASKPGWGPGTAAALGTGTAYLPGWGPGTTAALGTGAAANPAVQVTGLPAAALGTGTAYNPVAAIGVTALPAAALSTGAAYSPVAQVTGLPAAALGTGAAYLPAWSPGTIAALGTGTAYLPGWGPGTAAALGTGAASKPGWGPGTAAALGTGTAYLPGWGPGTPAALATAIAYFPVFSFNNTVTPTAALAAGAAYLAGWGPVADLATASGDTFLARWGPGTMTATASGAAGAVAPGWVPGSAAASGDTSGPFISYTAGAALGTAAAGKPGWGPVTGAGLAAGAAYAAAPPAVTALPAAAPGTGGSFGPVELSPALEGFGFGTFPQVPVNSVILSVIADVVWYGSDAGMQAPFYELWDGTSARIGTRMSGTASTTAGHRDSVVFTGVTYSQLATLRLRIYATSLLSNAGATANFDAAALSVSWAANTSAAVAPAALAIVPAFPAVSVGNSITATLPVAAGTGAAYLAAGSGNVDAAALPAALAVVPVFPAVFVSIGQTVPAPLLMVVPVLPAITDVTGPGWAVSDDQPVGGTGSWTNPGNILGPPDGSVAVWTSV